jgi:translocation and assembly module TamA
MAAIIAFTPAREAWALDAPAQKPTSDSPATQTSDSFSAPSLKFAVQVEGTKLPDDIKAQIAATIELGKEGVAGQPATLGQLRRRANVEAKNLDKVLRSQAYFSGRIEPVINEAAGGRFDLTYRVTLGPRTMIHSFVITYADHPSDEATLIKDATALGLKPQRAARAQRIIDLTSDTLTWLQNHGHPTPKLEKREVIVDLAAKVADITLTINAGAPKRFGNLVIDNHAHDGEAPRTAPDYIQSLAAFSPGDLYDRRKADATIDALRQTNLFNQVSIEVVDADDSTQVDRLTPKLILAERESRSVGAGARWSSDEGAGVRGFWEHRNLFGRAEKLRLEVSVAQNKKSATAEFSKPRFLRADQSLLADFAYAHENTDAYNEDSTKLGVALSRRITPTIQGSAGVSLEIYRTQDSTGGHSYRLFGLPLTLRYDGSDNLLDPTEGARLSGAFTPYAGQANGSPAAFSKFEAAGSTYISFGKRPDVTLAFRGRYGLMLAQDTLDVPGSLRFYAGGGGSIRGYGYQLVGPLDAANDPLGGRSVLEGSTEARYRLTETLGLVAFVDTGNAYATATPQPSKGLQWGAGVGIRYYTPIGPVRADIAVPLNKRQGIDDSFQVYFSLGQAF